MSMMLETHWSISLSLVNNPKPSESFIQAVYREIYRARVMEIKPAVWSTDLYILLPSVAVIF